MINSQSELASEETHVKFGDPKNNRKTFLFDPTVVFLRRVQGPGGICDRSLITNREAVKYDCSDAQLFLFFDADSSFHLLIDPLSEA